jgi:hypothetical protein
MFQTLHHSFSVKLKNRIPGFKNYGDHGISFRVSGLKRDNILPTLNYIYGVGPKMMNFRNKIEK